MPPLVVMRGAWIAVMLVSLAGCLGGKGDDGGGGDLGEEGAASPLTNSTASLTAAISVRINGTLAVPSNGSIVANQSVTLTFDGSDSTGAILTYAWDFGDNVTSEDRVAEHAYAAAGNYTVRLTVANGNASANATVAVTVPGETGGDPLFTSSEEFSGTLPVGLVNSPTASGVDYIDHTVVVAAAGPDGTPALAVVARATVSAAPGNQMFLYWKAPDGTDLATAGDIPDADGEAALTYEGAMPAGEYVLRVRLLAGAGAMYTATLELDYVTA